MAAAHLCIALDLLLKCKVSCCHAFGIFLSNLKACLQDRTFTQDFPKEDRQQSTNTAPHVCIHRAHACSRHIFKQAERAAERQLTCAALLPSCSSASAALLASRSDSSLACTGELHVSTQVCRETNRLRRARHLPQLLVSPPVQLLKLLASYCLQDFALPMQPAAR